MHKNDTMAEAGYKIRNAEGIHFVTFAVVEWVDVFTRKDYKDVLVESLSFCQQKKGLVLYGWCTMSNHVHFMASAKENNLSDILRDFKKYTSTKITSSINKNSPLSVASSHYCSKPCWVVRFHRRAMTYL